ncbi:MAG: hypothetical protein JXO72_16185 [Vicinamibacteria bacterium]|nr:hypothetical protein [Vicinamibacteria bacterium]
MHPPTRTETPAVTRLLGLERLYFECVTALGQSSLHASAVRAALPRDLKGSPSAGDTLRDEDGFEVDVSIADFAVPAFSRDTRIVLRQVTDQSHRIHGIWWAIYLEGRRQDVWYFEASPDRTDGKLLANHTIKRVIRETNDQIVIDIVSTMFRPQGAMWISAWRLVFAVVSGGLAYQRAEERYGISRGYDDGEKPPSSTYWTARRNGREIEVMTVLDAPEAVVASCENQPSTAGDDGESDIDVERTALCVTSRVKAQVAKRSIDAPGFIERGGIRHSQ